MSLLRNTSWSALAAVAMSGGRFVLMAILARTLGPAQLGEFMFLQWLVEFVFLFVSFGTMGAGIRFFSQYRAEGRPGSHTFAHWYALRSFQVLVLAAIVTPAAVYLFTTFHSMLSLALIWAISSGLWAVTTARLQGLQLFAGVAISNLTFACVAVGGMLFVPKGSGLSWPVFVLVVAASIASLICLQFKPSRSPAVHHQSAPFSRAMVSSYALNVWVASLVAALVWSRAEFSVVRGLLTNVDLALYGAALTLAGLANLGIALLTGALGPRLAELWDKGSEIEVFELSREVTDYLVLAAGVGIGFIVTFPSELLALAFGVEYRAAKTPLVLLAIGAFGLTSGCVNIVSQYKTNGTFARNINLVGAVMLLLLMVPLTFWLGVSGASFARCVMQLAVALGAFLFAAARVSQSALSWRNIISTWALVVLVAGISNSSIHTGLWARAAMYAGFLAVLLATLRMGGNNATVVVWARDLVWEYKNRNFAND